MEWQLLYAHCFALLCCIGGSPIAHMQSVLHKWWMNLPGCVCFVDLGWVYSEGKSAAHGYSVGDSRVDAW